MSSSSSSSSLSDVNKEAEEIQETMNRRLKETMVELRAREEELRAELEKADDGNWDPTLPLGKVTTEEVLLPNEADSEIDMVNQNFAQIISILEKRVMGDSDQLNDQRIRMLRRELTTKKKTIRLLEIQNRQLEKEMKNQEEIFRLKEANLHMALDGKNQLVGKFGTDVSDYVKVLIQEKNELEDRVEKYEDQEEEYQEEIEKLKGELKMEKEKNKKLTEELEEKAEELAEIEESMEVEEEKMEALQRELDESRGRIQGLKDLTSLKLIARFDVSQIHQLSSMIATQKPEQPSETARERTAKCRGIYSEVLKENPDTPKLMQLGDLVDLIWKGTDKGQIKKILHNLRQHQKYKDLDGWSNTEELEQLLAQRAVKMEQQEVVVPGTVTEIIREDRVLWAPKKDSGLFDF